MYNLDKAKGGYVFISHSHYDIQKVRQIRNAMEEEGFEPLCFYLKCLTDDDEIEGLIKREIDAREWFVYIDSPNSRASAWVRKERDYISSLDSKQIITVELDKQNSMKEVSETLIEALRLCIVCEKSDSDTADALRRCFIEKDMQTTLCICDDDSEQNREVFFDESVGFAENSGTVVAILSQNSVYNTRFDELLRKINSTGVKIIPISLEGYRYTDYRNGMLRDVKAAYNLYDPKNKPLMEDIVRRVVHDISHDYAKAFSEARSHNEVDTYLKKNYDNPEAEKLAFEAHDRLDEEERIKDDIRTGIELGTIKLTDELKKFLES